MFVWTISDVIGLTLLAVAALFFGVLFSIILVQDWLMKRRTKGKRA